MSKTLLLVAAVSLTAALAGCATSNGSTVALSSARPDVTTTTASAVRPAGPPPALRLYPGDENNTSSD